MPTLLQLDSSADLTGSASRRLTARFADGWRTRGHRVVNRDLFVDQPPHLPTNALHWAPALRLPAESVAPADEAYQTQLIEELLNADVVLLGAPMYNWSVPSTLKAWIDWIHVPGLTAPAGADDPAPLGGKPIVIASGRGLAYGPGTGMDDHELAALTQLFAGSMQMTVYPVLAELTLAGRVSDLAPRAADGAASLAAAEAEIDRLVAELG
ncbi:FMN-dependent NADH-azoreductase [Microlunatus ginsengisoli]|uniref:FMN dependent NADH:quinone oxidoreductase n=1 Tax=Microlunatus ginsengisoli TaxID=363863 RepID=A0ABP7AMP0_9ACTN